MPPRVGHVTTTTPLELVADDQASAAEVPASLEILHELGMLGWDADSRIHLLIERTNT